MKLGGSEIDIDIDEMKLDHEEMKCDASEIDVGINEIKPGVKEIDFNTNEEALSGAEIASSCIEIEVGKELMEPISLTAPGVRLLKWLFAWPIVLKPLISTKHSYKDFNERTTRGPFAIPS